MAEYGQQKQDSNKADYRNAAHFKMSRGWQIMEDTCEGTLALREAGKEYLPSEAAEDSREYEIRRRRAVFFNAVSRTLGGLVGMVFRKEPKLNDDVPVFIRGQEAVEAKPATEGQSATASVTKIEGHWENIDNAGTHGSVFTKEVFDDAMKKGHAAILVDMPGPLPPGATRADEIASGRRPYWVSYSADDIINWRTKNVRGKTQLDLIVFRECTQEADGEYGEKTVTRFRVFRGPRVVYTEGAVGVYEYASWELFELLEGKDSRDNLIRIDGGELPFTEIPVAVVYGRKTGYLTSQPPLLDIALINIAHYQKYSDFSTYLHLCQPILWFRARNTDENVKPIGPYTFFDVGDNGVVDFAEPQGGALSAADLDIKNLEARMAALGLSIVVGGNKEQASTATEEVLDHVREDSDLATAARSLKDAIERCLKFHAQYVNASETTGGSVELGATIEELVITPQELTAYSNMVAAKQISLDTLWALMARAGKLPADFDADKEKETIKKDAEDAFDQSLAQFERGDVGGFPGGRPGAKPPANNKDQGGGNEG